MVVKEYKEKIKTLEKEKNRVVKKLGEVIVEGLCSGKAIEFKLIDKKRNS